MSHNTESIYKAARAYTYGTDRNAGARDDAAKERVRLLHRRLTKPAAPKPNIQGLNSWTDEDKARQLRLRVKAIADEPANKAALARMGVELRDQSEDRVLPPFLLAYRDGATDLRQNGYYVMARATGEQASVWAYPDAERVARYVATYNEQRGWRE